MYVDSVISPHVIPAVVSGEPGNVMKKVPCVYMLSSKRNGTLYIGVTSDLIGRCWQYKQGVVSGFTKTYAVKQLMYYELHETMADAITREKQLKKWNRAWKISRIEQQNPEWKDLLNEIM